MLLVDVAHAGDPNVLSPEQSADMPVSHAADTDHCNLDLVVDGNRSR